MAGMGAGALINKIFGGGKGAPSTSNGRPVVRPPTKSSPTTTAQTETNPTTTPTETVTTTPQTETNPPTVQADTNPTTTRGYKANAEDQNSDNAAGSPTPVQPGVDTVMADSNSYYIDDKGNVYDSDGFLVLAANATSTDGQDQTFTDEWEDVYDSGGSLLYAADPTSTDNTYIADNTSIDNTDTTVAKDGGFMTLLYNRGGHVPHFDDGGGASVDASTTDNSSSSGDVNAGRTDMGDGTFEENNGDNTYSYFDRKGTWLYTTDSSGGLLAGAGADGNPVFYDNQGNASSSPFAGVNQDNNQSGILNSIKDFVSGNAGAGTLNSIKDFVSSNAGAGVLGALIGNLMSQGSSTPAVNQGMDMAQLAAMQEGTPSNLSVGSGRDQYSGVLVPFDQYASWNPQYEQQLYSDLGVSGAGDQGGGAQDQSSDQVFQDDQGNYYDAQGNPINMSQQQYSDGGSTHFTYGKVITPADNLSMRRGGLSQAHTMHSHHTNPLVNGRIDFRHGSSVNGAGDGQSDDIPAMLADGEYVIDAETVAQLGNGSNKAGAKVLDKFREEIRKHKRNAPLDKIPPKSKSPLAYLKEAMNG